MGGIKLDHVQELVARGARRMAVVTALTQAEDIEAETRRWVEAINKASSLVSILFKNFIRLSLVSIL